MSVLTIPIVPPNINKVSELAEDPRPVASFSDTFFLIANQSTDPAVKKISETYIVHYDMKEAIRNASESLGVMCEATTFLQYTIRLADRQGCRDIELVQVSVYKQVWTVEHDHHERASHLLRCILCFVQELSLHRQVGQ